MSRINTNQIKSKISNEISKIYSSDISNAVSVLGLTLSKDNMYSGEPDTITVPNINALPNLYFYNNQLPQGMIYFVEDIKIFAISANNKWITTDGITLREDNFVDKLYSFGNNQCGILGDNSIIQRASPVMTVDAFPDWCDIGPGHLNHTLAIRTNGTIWAWGNGDGGRLGTNDTVTRSSPVKVVGDSGVWTAVSAGGSSSQALRNNGTIWSWGNGFAGKLGSGNTINTSSPVSVVGGFTDWCAVSSGYDFSIALRRNGTAWGWGSGCFNQLGNQSTGYGSCRCSPVQVCGGFTDWCQVSTGRQHSIGVRTNGTIWGWGYNTCGRVGDNTVTNRASPVQVCGGFTDWCQVSAGLCHSMGVRLDGTVWAWGANGYGQLGNGTTTPSSSPVSVVGGFTDWCQVSAGSRQNLGLRTNGTIWAWGQNSNGQLGDGTTSSKCSPIQVVGGFTNWTKVRAGHSGASFGIVRLS
jgi:alpha-tubulin suppressor-like RCC1 family protein